jgi:spermidine dehydrogenase
MTKTDRDLGMDRSITRRDFLNGVSVAVGGSLLGAGAAAGHPAPRDEEWMQRAQPSMTGEIYPPALTGMRGSGPGMMDAAHAMRDGKTWDSVQDVAESYDLIVVGAGMSGLAAAYFFRKKTTADAKILILDNHDDFGGHARRVEFNVDGRLLIAKGGTSYIERPATYTAEGKELLKDIGVNYYERTAKREPEFYQKRGMKQAVYFDKETFGEDRFVVNDVVLPPGGGGLQARDPGPSPEFLAKTPLSEQVRKDLLRLYRDKVDYLAGMSTEEKMQKLRKTSYRDYLVDVVKVHPDLLKYYHPMGQPAALITETTSAWWSFNWNYPGFEGLGLEKAPDAGENLDEARPDKNEPTQFHFPEGNGGVARLLIRWLIPEALPARGMVDAETNRVRYTRLDDAGQPVRIRLNSTVVRVKNNNPDPYKATETEVVYVRDGKAYRVRGKGCVLACYNSAIPYMVPELPEKQKEALHKAVRAVMMTTNVALGNWKTFEKMGVYSVSSPGSAYPGYGSVGLMNQISLGSYKAPATPDQPIVVTLGGGIDFNWKAGMTARDMFRATRAALYETTFETFERRIRTHLARVLSSGGFDPAAEIQGITISRWGHGYAMGMNLLYDPDWTEDEYPWVVGRKRFGRITIANSDAEGVCLTQAAFDQAHRAVDELMKRQVAWWNRV